MINQGDGLICTSGSDQQQRGSDPNPTVKMQVSYNSISEYEDDDDHHPATASLLSGTIPQEATNLDYIDAVIAKQMSQLSVQDREKAYMDVHGVSDLVEETPEMVEGGLVQLESEILLLKDRAAYDLAESMDPSYTRNRDFRLAFLRTELFDSQKAALRITRHFQMKLDLFGSNRLVMDITQDDLDTAAMGTLYRGNARFLSATDRAGRIINLLVAPQGEFSTISLLRRGFYSTMVAFRDPEAQRRGVVVVGYFIGQGNGSGQSSDATWKFPKLHRCLPMRVAAIHLCYDNTLWRPVHALLKTSLNMVARIRIRTHYGSHNECLASLRGHGIEPDVIPVTEGGTISDIDSYRQRLVRQRRQERLSQPRRMMIYVPMSRDVLFGKGTPVQNHLGNKKFRALIADCQKSYEKANNGEKTILVQDIVDTVIQSSGMFLKPDGDVWLPVENDAARRKVSTAFRTMRKACN